MATYNIKDIRKDVKVAMDLNREDNSLLDVETLSINELIDSNIIDSIKQVHSIAPVNLIDGAETFTSINVIGVLQNNKYIGAEILLPDDFMRLVLLKIDKWATPIYSLLPIDSIEYKRQGSAFAGVRGVNANPKCFYTTRSYGRVIEAYPYQENSQVSQFAYLPYPEIEEVEGERFVKICEKCYKAVVYTIASMVLATLGEVDKSNILSELAKTSLL